MLRTQDLGEADLIVSLVGRRHGKVRGVARAARGSRRRFGGALEPLTRVQAAWNERDGQELSRIERLELARSFAAMQADPLLQAACAVLAELAEAYAREGEGDAKTFDLLAAALEALERGVDAGTVVRYFEFWLLRLSGLLGEPGACAQCGAELRAGAGGWLDPRRGIVCAACRGDEPGARIVRLAAADRACLVAFRRRAPQELEAHVRARPGGELERLLRGLLEGFAERSFRSYRHLAAAAAMARGDA